LGVLLIQINLSLSFGRARRRQARDRNGPCVSESRFGSRDYDGDPKAVAMLHGLIRVKAGIRAQWSAGALH